MGVCPWGPWQEGVGWPCLVLPAPWASHTSHTPLPDCALQAYLYLDEAHSIGASGRSGRGLCEQAGVNPDDVDVLMGGWRAGLAGNGGGGGGSIPAAHATDANRP